MRILILYSSTDGQTKIISQKIREILSYNHKVQLSSIQNGSSLSIDSFDKIVIGASIRYGKHKKELYDFIKLNQKILDNKKNAFFSISVVARKLDKNTAETNPYVKKFLKISKWRPNKIEVFAGKIDYPKYSFFDKHIIRLIMYLTKGPTNTSQSYEFTDWSKVDNFAQELSENW